MLVRADLYGSTMTATDRHDSEPSVMDQWLTRAEVATRYQLAPATLAYWATKHTGPPYSHFGRHVRYRLSDLLEWEAGQRARSSVTGSEAQ